jgi:hypothetical protein
MTTTHPKKVEWYILLDQKTGQRIVLDKGTIIAFFKSEEAAWKFLYTRVDKEMQEGLRPVKIDIILPLIEESITYKEERVIDL